MFGDEKQANKDQYTKEFKKNPNSKESKMTGIESYILYIYTYVKCMHVFVCV